MAESKDTRDMGAESAAPTHPEEDDVRVPVDTDDAEVEPEAGKVEADVEVTEAEAADAEKVVEPEAIDPEDEEAMVAEAIRRGEEAAERDLKADADAIRAERDEIARKLADAEEALKAAEAKAADAVDRHARLQADWDNYRRRTATERLAERELANQKLVGNLLPVIDDMERAVAHATSGDDVPDELRQFADGVSAVRTKMLGILGQDGVEAFDPNGEPFDPMFHQAVGRVEDADEYEGTVRDVYQLGYKMAGKVIRPAMVTVTFGGQPRPTEEPAEPEGGATEATAADEAEQAE